MGKYQELIERLHSPAWWDLENDCSLLEEAEAAVRKLEEYVDTGLEPMEIKQLQNGYEMQYKSLTYLLCEEAENVTVQHMKELIQAEQEGQDAQELYHLALDTWGADAQTLMVFEEMSELQKELCKHERGKDNREAIADEIADVLIMLEQMMILHDCEQVVYEHKAAKLKRLADRLSNDGAALDGEGNEKTAEEPEWKQRMMQTFLGGR